MALKQHNENRQYYYYRSEAFRTLRHVPELARMLKAELPQLEHHVNQPLYCEFKIPKKKGGHRTIQAPGEELKAIQKKLNNYLQAMYYNQKPSCVHGFVVNPFAAEYSCDIRSNALAHTGKKYLLNIDLKDFFGSVSAAILRTALQNEPFAMHAEPATVIALLGTYQKKLPTGAPSSPVLANIAMYETDVLLQDYCLKNGVVYTRYADDMSFSSDTFFEKLFIEELKAIIRSQGFEINDRKFRLNNRQSRQTVTGLVVNEKVNVDRRYIRRLRAILHSCSLLGTDVACAKHYGARELNPKQLETFRCKLKGQIEFVGQVRGKDDNLYKKFKALWEQI